MKQKIDEFKKKWFRPFPNTEEGNRLREERESDLNALLREVAEKQREAGDKRIDEAVFYAEPEDPDIVYLRLSEIKNTPLTTK